MRISDWSSDVCSSDLGRLGIGGGGFEGEGGVGQVVSPGGGVDRGVPIVAEGPCGSGFSREVWLPPLRRQGQGQTLRPALPAHALRRVLQHDALGRELVADGVGAGRSEEHTSELQSLMRISYAVFCLKKKKTTATEMK